MDHSQKYEEVARYYKEQRPFLKRIAKRLIVSRKAANIEWEDLIQETFFRFLAYSNFDKVNEEDKNGYVFRSMANTLSTMMSKKRELSSSYEEIYDGGDIPGLKDYGIFLDFEEEITNNPVLLHYYINAYPLRELPFATGVKYNECKKIIRSFRNRILKELQL